jgi:tetratricopeptide (TPR) repeat protein
MHTASPDHTPEDHFLAATAQMGKGESLQALAICIVGLDRYPEDPKLLCLAGQCCIALDRLDEAGLYIDKARSANVGMSRAHEVHGDLMLVQSMPGEAVKSYRQAARLDPSREGIPVKIERARVIMNRNRPQQGKRRQALGFPEEMATAGKLERDGEHGQAEAIYRKILRRDPEHVEAMRMLAAVAVKHEKFDDAEVFLQHALTIAPDYARLWLDLTAAQLQQDKLEEAIDSASRLAELTPDIAESHITLGNALARTDRAQAAVEAYRAALDITHGHPGALSGLAQQLKTLGRQEESIEVHRENILRNPANAEPYWSLANMKTFCFTDQEIERMESLLLRDDLDELSQVQLSNALGFAYEGRRDFDRAFAYFQRCNDKRRESEIYDPVETEVATSRYIEVFTEEFIGSSEGHGDPDPSPIFIVGLPRSGSTLIEQILASHSQVEGTHELADMAIVARSIPRPRGKRDRFPDNLPGLKAPNWEKIGRRYLDRTVKYRSGAPCFIDKNPNNFVYAGLIHLILPNARIINARRHPMDSCFGSYKQLFASGQPFTYDLTEIGEYYVQYQRLMEHWHNVMPGRILDVDYENVVEDLETQVRRILDYCGLPFESACLEFHRTERAVKTASSEQVRQPIYSSSVDLWKYYEPHLSELKEVLEPVLRQRSGAAAISRPIG